jgi:uncharacterized protein YjiK
VATRLFRASILFALGSMATLSSGCSTDSESGSASEHDLGSIGLSLQLASGTTLNSVSYTITGPNSFSRAGTIDVSHSTVISTTIGGLPAGTGFSIELDATTTDGGTHCGGAAAFDVAAQVTTAVSVHLTCNEPAHTGSALVNGVLNICPTVDGISASPAEVSVGSSLTLSASAHDSDGGPAPIAYHWTTTGGTLSASDTQSPSLTCTTTGTVTVSVTATDSDCSGTLSTTLTCSPGGSGGSGGSGGASGSGGAAGSAGTGGPSAGASGSGGTGGASGGSMDLSRYVRVGRYALPEPTRTTPPDSTSLLAQEASTVTYDWDTDTLFVVGDGGTSVVQVSKTGALIDSMTLAPGGSPQGTEFYDTEGASYVGGGKFVLIEERYRQANLFTYVAGTTLTRAAVQTVKLGTTIGNIGLEGVTYDPATGNYIFVKEKEPESIFLTSIDWAAGTASNGSPTTDESTNLFDPSLVNTLDFSDVYALSNLPALAGDPTFQQLLIISQESGKIVQVDRSGNVKHSMTIVADPSDTISVPDMTMEGVTMDRSGFLYVDNEDGGGDVNHPELWVYAPSTAPDLPPTAVSLTGAVTSLPDNTNTTGAVKLADIFVADDGIGDNNLSLSGPDASSFEIIGTALFLKAGTALSAATQASYNLSVNVDDATVGATPDASTAYTLTITPASSGTTNIAITEVAPWSSGNSPLAADWFEATNFGTSSVSLVGWTMDDNSNSFAVSVPLNGITSIAPGESVIFIETTSSSGLAAAAQSFINLWFGGTAPAGLQIGSYSGSGVGLSTGGDAVNLFDSGGTVHAAISFGASPSGTPLPTFDNSAGLNNVVVSNLSVVGQAGAFVAAGDSNEIGSPGTVGSGGTMVNEPPTAVTLLDTVPTISEGADVSSDVRVADISVTDDGLGTNNLSVSGTDAASFEIVGSSLYLKAGTALSHASKPTLSVTVAVDDPTVGGSPDATASFTLTVTPGVAPSSLVISEVAPWSSSSSLGADWFEVTNTGTAPVDVTGWKMDDNSHSFANAVPLSGITSIAPGEAVIFIETASLTTLAANFRSLWFGANPQRTTQIGSYSGSGVGLSTSGDEVNLFDSAGNLVTGVGFGTAPSTAPFATFDNHAGAGSSTLPVPIISTLSATGVNGAFVAAGDATEIGSPGIGNVGALIVTEVAPWASSNSPYMADWFEVTNVGGAPVDMTGWKMDDNSNAFASAVPIVGVGSITPGQSAVLIEGTAATASSFATAWFGTSPAGFPIGSYTGSGVGLSTSGDAVNLFNPSGVHITGVQFGTATTGFTFDNTAGLATVTTLSVAGVNGAFLAPDGIETGSPGTIH